MRFEGKVALVTGSGSGIGEVTVHRLAAEGAAVVVADRDGGRARAVAAAIEAAGGKALATETDVSEGAQVEAMVAAALEAFARVDVLVNNAAVAEADGVLVTDEAAWEREVDVDLKSAFLCTKAVLPGMIERRGGAIVNVASVNGLAFFGLEAYSAAKAGMISLTRSVAVRYGAHGVRVNAVAPGSIRTPIWEQFLEEDPGVFERLVKWYPLGRIGEPDDVANAVLFLASDEAAWVTGSVLTVDGGLLAGNPVMAREVLVKAKEPFPAGPGRA